MSCFLEKVAEFVWYAFTITCAVLFGVLLLAFLFALVGEL